jgi:hypothetical protein
MPMAMVIPMALTFSLGKDNSLARLRKSQVRPSLNLMFAACWPLRASFPIAARHDKLLAASDLSP